MSGLVDHLESRWGRVCEGWSREAVGDFQMACFEGGALEGLRSWSTLGLSEHVLTTDNPQRGLRLELMMCVHRALSHDAWPTLLREVALRSLATHRALLRGDVVAVEALPGSGMSALYAASPVYFDPQFAEVSLQDGASAAIVWLVPIGNGERAFVAQHGWEEFERHLAQRDPDLLHPRRKDMFAEW